jgi:methionyl-tRNA synthetase
MLKAFGAEDAAESWPTDVATAMQALAPGDAFTVPDNMFAKITDDAREEMQARFSGTEAA